jgi:hypothetical protein
VAKSKNWNKDNNKDNKEDVCALPISNPRRGRGPGGQPPHAHSETTFPLVKREARACHFEGPGQLSLTNPADSGLYFRRIMLRKFFTPANLILSTV